MRLLARIESGRRSLLAIPEFDARRDASLGLGRSPDSENLNASKDGLARGSNPAPRLNKTVLDELTPSQKRTAHRRLISNAEEFIALTKERRSALITAAVTGQIDVEEMADG